MNVRDLSHLARAQSTESVDSSCGVNDWAAACSAHNNTAQCEVRLSYEQLVGFGQQLYIFHELKQL